VKFGDMLSVQKDVQYQLTKRTQPFHQTFFHREISVGPTMTKQNFEASRDQRRQRRVRRVVTKLRKRRVHRIHLKLVNMLLFIILGLQCGWNALLCCRNRDNISFYVPYPIEWDKVVLLKTALSNFGPKQANKW
jgi:hypothetical protein